MKFFSLKDIDKQPRNNAYYKAMLYKIISKNLATSLISHTILNFNNKKTNYIEVEVIKSNKIIWLSLDYGYNLFYTTGCPN